MNDLRSPSFRVLHTEVDDLRRRFESLSLWWLHVECRLLFGSVPSVGLFSRPLRAAFSSIGRIQSYRVTELVCPSSTPLVALCSCSRILLLSLGILLILFCLCPPPHSSSSFFHLHILTNPSLHLRLFVYPTSNYNPHRLRQLRVSPSSRPHRIAFTVPSPFRIDFTVITTTRATSAKHRRTAPRNRTLNLQCPMSAPVSAAGSPISTPFPPSSSSGSGPASISGSASGSRSGSGVPNGPERMKIERTDRTERTDRAERTERPELTASGCVRRKRVRTVTGCLVCRRRRVKCDEGRVSQ